MTAAGEAKAVRAAATRSTLLAVARERFAEAGYHATSTTDLVALASVTRGALYHHFADKEALFEAVLREVADDVNKRAQATVAGLSGDTWRQMTESFDAYLGLVTADAGIQRILLIDGPAVLGWGRWRDLQAELILADVVTTLRMLMDSGVVARRPPEPLAQLVLALLNEAALEIAHGTAAEVAGDALHVLVRGLRAA
ncbi:TetR/AcrR family transcriptional regulator [Trujillonella endophytica]|uniref:Transcriptional regulator, TetR family n=1 Tax=Trujillonella endophytica TaxID=673521 RepID=A0A1H8SVL7_9ACTN|nr:TetR/AcrR family transcriptional regulator [Trujillella endophytica]SEO82526.1 transcriptional regulator, TetR family [Trujillella endophytica]